MNSEYSSACDADVSGLIVYEIITGIKPFTGLLMYEILGKITQGIPQELKKQLEFKFFFFNFELSIS